MHCVCVRLCACVFQRSARVSMESRCQHLLPSLEWSRSQHPSNFPVSMSLGLNIPEISQSQWVSVMTSKKFFILDDSRSRHPTYIPVSMSPSFDNQKRLVESLSQTKKRNLTKLDKFNQNQFIYWTKFNFYIIKLEKIGPTNQKTRII